MTLEINNNQYLNETINLKTTIEESFIVLGARLMKIRDEEIYKTEYESFADFLMEMKMSESVASKMIKVYKTFLLDWKIDAKKVIDCGGYGMAYEIAKHAQTKEEAEDLLDKGKTLTKKDMEDELREMRNPTCNHENTYEIEVCKDCGKKVKVYEDQD